MAKAIPAAVEEQQHEEALELVEKDGEGSASGRLLQPIGAKPLEAPCRRLVRQSTGPVGPQIPGGYINGSRVPRLHDLSGLWFYDRSGSALRVSKRSIADPDPPRSPSAPVHDVRDPRQLRVERPHPCFAALLITACAAGIPGSKRGGRCRSW